MSTPPTPRQRYSQPIPEQIMPPFVTLKIDAITESGVTIAAGTRVEYCGHIIGGMIKIRMHDDSYQIIHPTTTHELS